MSRIKRFHTWWSQNVSFQCTLSLKATGKYDPLKYKSESEDDRGPRRQEIQYRREINQILQMAAVRY